MLGQSSKATQLDRGGRFNERITSPLPGPAPTAQPGRARWTPRRLPQDKYLGESTGLRVLELQ